MCHFGPPHLKTVGEVIRDLETVTGRRLNEVRTSEVGTTVSQQQIETTPQITRKPCRRP